MRHSSQYLFFTASYGTNKHFGKSARGIQNPVAAMEWTCFADRCVLFNHCFGWH